MHDNAAHLSPTLQVMKTLPLSAQHHLEAAEGWIELGNFEEAKKELKQINARFKSHPDVLVMRNRVHCSHDSWDDVFKLVLKMRNSMPEKTRMCFYLAMIQFYEGRYQEAYDTLLPAVYQLPGEWRISYCLACYCCKLGKVKEAMKWLEKAIDLGCEDLRQRALEDPDFEPLWAQKGHAPRHGRRRRRSVKLNMAAPGRGLRPPPKPPTAHP